MLREDA
ncbi:hypothetical protein XBFM1_1350020 [Xenorhabdus bovienii str. feltiae Moldova]|nr:hypothetical protein XBFM1_1350020 [Xenorhabdus bovienii str. feltiae Moldova]CDM90637.1 protein of unknown function [Xenorhabdus bovienii]